PQLARPEQRLGGTGIHHPERSVGRRGLVVAGPGTHRFTEGGAGLGRGGVPRAAHVVVAVVDAPGVGGHRRDGTRSPRPPYVAVATRCARSVAPSGKAAGPPRRRQEVSESRRDAT